jgi:hypothetical protein
MIIDATDCPENDRALRSVLAVKIGAWHISPPFIHLAALLKDGSFLPSTTFANQTKLGRKSECPLFSSCPT